MLESLKRSHLNLKAKTLRYFRSREVVKVLSQVHAKELAETPVAQWAVKKSQQSQEIAAVKAGKFDIIDRRSWQFPYIPEALHRLNQPILKNTPYSLRRFSETPIARRAINLTKDALLSLRWHITIDDKFDQDDPDLLKKVDIATYCMNHPNLVDSYRTLMEAVVEDFLIGGYGTMEPQLTPDYRRPFKIWAVDGSTIRIYADWSESTPDRPHYAQLTGLKGERGHIAFLDDELVYVRDNVRSSTPFGLGRMEIAFLTCNAFLGAQDMSSRAGSDQIHKTWLWWANNVPAGQLETVRRHIQNDAEGQAKVSLMTGLPKPEIIEVQPVTPEDLLLEWQELLIRIMAAAFQLSPMSLGLERDVNRNTSQTMAEQDFNSAVVPVARKFEEAITRGILHKTLGWRELKFEFVGLEDPDEMIQVQLIRQLYASNAITPDEARERLQIGEPLPGGWGKLTQAQMQLIIGAVTGKAGGGMGMSGQSGGATGTGNGSYGGQSGFGGNPGNSIGMNAAKSDTTLRGAAAPAQSLDQSPWSAQELAMMDPQTLETYRQAGLVPQNAHDLINGMEDQQPGILQTLSEELLEYFEWLEQEEEENQEKPSPVTAKDQKDQQTKFKQRQQDLQKEDAKARSTAKGTTLYQNQQPGYRGPFPRRSMTGLNNKKKWNPRFGGRTNK